MKNKIQKLFSNQKLRVFLFFLLVSSISLMLNKLSKEYKSTLKFKIIATHLPSDKILLKQPDNVITLYVKATGFNLLGYKIINKSIGVNASYAKKVYGTTYKIDSNKLIDDLQHELSSDTEIVEILDPTIYLEMGTIISKKIPISINSNLTYEKGYKIKGNLVITPDSIKVTGPEDVVKKILKIDSKQLVVKNIYTNFNEDIDLLVPKEYKNLQFSDDRVNVSAEVEKYTEISYMLPVKILNKPKDKSVEIFPSKVQIVFQIELSEISKINTDKFVIACDVGYSLQNNLTYLIPEVVEKPATIKNFHIIPTKIDYLLR